MVEFLRGMVGTMVIQTIGKIALTLGAQYVGRRVAQRARRSFKRRTANSRLVRGASAGLRYGRNTYRAYRVMKRANRIRRQVNRRRRR